MPEDDPYSTINETKIGDIIIINDISTITIITVIDIIIKKCSYLPD